MRLLLITARVEERRLGATPTQERPPHHTTGGATRAVVGDGWAVHHDKGEASNEPRPPL